MIHFNVNNVINDEYKKLLKKGIQNIDCGNEASLEDNLLSNKSELETIRKINSYVYTTYSTNNIDKTYSIDLFILNNYSKILIDKLRFKNFWFMTKEYGNNNIIIEINKELNNSTYKHYIDINEDKEDLYDSKYWNIIKKDNNIITLERDADIYFLSDNTINSFKKSSFNDDYFIKELEFNYYNIDNKIDYNLLSKNISYFIIEDPIIGREKLYDELLIILEEICI
jgi:hypothetical protein